MYDGSVNGHGASSPTQGGAPNVGWELGARGAAAQRPHDTWWRLLRRATVVGAGVSLMLHLVLWAIVSLWTVKYEHADAGGAKGSVVDFAVMSDVELSALQSADLEMDAPSVPDVGGAEAAPVELIAALTGAESITPDLARVQLSLGGGTASSSSFDLSAPGSGASGSGSGASFFGLEAQGRRFAYIVDRSGSMAYDAGGVTRLRLTQDELSRSIDALLDRRRVLHRHVLRRPRHHRQAPCLDRRHHAQEALGTLRDRARHRRRRNPPNGRLRDRLPSAPATRRDLLHDRRTLLRERPPGDQGDERSGPHPDPLHHVRRVLRRRRPRRRRADDADDRDRLGRELRPRRGQAP